MKIAYFGYDFFYKCLEHLHQQGHEILRIYTYNTDGKYNFNDRITDLAEEAKAPIQYSKVTESDLDILSEQGCDLLVSAAYPYKIPVRKCSIPGINIHPTILPEGRGPWPLPHVILNGLVETGVTIHKLDENLDSGDILIQDSFPVLENENLESLSCKCQMTALKLLKDLMADFQSHWDKSVPQGKGSYWPQLSDEEMTVKWDKSVADIDRLIRAIGKFESIAVFNENTWAIQDATVWSEKHTYAPGVVVHETNKEKVISAKDGFVCLRFFARDIES